MENESIGRFLAPFFVWTTQLTGHRDKTLSNPLIFLFFIVRVNLYMDCIKLPLFTGVP